MLLPRGLICPLLTPLKPNGEIDTVGLKQLWEYVVPHVDGLSLGSSFSLEGVYLNCEQKQALFKIVSGFWDEKTPLFLNITGVDEACTLQLAQLTATLFASHLDKVVIEVLPLWYRSNRGLPQHLDNLHLQTKATFVIANHPLIIKQKRPFLKHANIRTAVFKKIAQRKFVKGIIFQGDLNRFFNYQHALHGRDDFSFYEGDEVSFLNQPTSDGVVAFTANFVPVLWEKLVKQVLNPAGIAKNDSTAIFALGEKLRELQNICASSPAMLKWALGEMGILKEVYSPVPLSSEENLKKLKQWLSKYGMPSNPESQV